MVRGAVRAAYVDGGRHAGGGVYGAAAAGAGVSGGRYVRYCAGRWYGSGGRCHPAGLVLALCLLRCNVTVDRGELLRKCALLLVACGVVVLFVRDGTLSYTGTGLLMGLFVLFVMQSIAYQYRFAFREGLELITVQKEKGEKTPPEDPSGRTVLFPAMSIRTSLRNLAGVVGGMAVLCMGAWALLNSAVALANLTGTIQAQWAATLISFGLCLPLLVEVFDHPLGSAWKRFAENAASTRRRHCPCRC